jgi:1-deoxyxylulose-5-phosphate synthase
MTNPVVPFPEELETASPLWYGTGDFGASIRGEQAQKLVARYLEHGGRLFDTAHCYAFWAENAEAGSSERELSAALRAVGEPDDVLIATKGGHPDGGAKYPRPDKYISEETITQDVADCLERLGRDSIDLFYLHRDDPRVPADEIIDILNMQIEAGTVRFLGASNWSAERIRQANTYALANGLAPFVISQVMWSLVSPNWDMSQEPSNKYVSPAEKAIYEKLEMPIAAYSPTAAGWLADLSRKGGYDTPENRAKRQRLHQWAAKLGATPVQLAIAYLLHESLTVYPVFGTSRIEHMDEIMGGTDDLELDEDDMDWLEFGEDNRP